jgi:hypothetical protein
MSEVLVLKEPEIAIHLLVLALPEILLILFKVISEGDEGLVCLLALVDVDFNYLFEGDLLLLCCLLEELSVLPDVILDQLSHRLGCLGQVVGMGHVKIFEITN